MFVFLNGLFTDKLKANSVPEQPKEEKEAGKPSVAVAEPESSPNSAAEKPGKKAEPARIQQKDKKRWVVPCRVPVNLLGDSLRAAGCSCSAGSPPVSIFSAVLNLTKIICQDSLLVFLFHLLPWVPRGRWCHCTWGGTGPRLSSVGGDGFP